MFDYIAHFVRQMPVFIVSNWSYILKHSKQFLLKNKIPETKDYSTLEQIGLHRW
jgi:hypothetical protein